MTATPGHDAALVVAERVSARRAPVAIASASVSWGAGCHAVVGAPGDGGPLLLQVVAGRVAPRTGSVRVLDGRPTEASVRRRVAHVPLEAALPEVFRVDEVLALAEKLRDEPAQDASGRLSVLGVEGLARRDVRSLSRGEARAVALAEALTSTVVRVVLVEEPLVEIDPRAAGRVPDALRARARDGCVVVVATASVRDAGDLADDQVLVRRGAIVGRAPSGDALAGFWQDGSHARLRIVVEDARAAQALVAALGCEGDVVAIERFAGGVCVRGRDPAALSAGRRPRGRQRQRRGRGAPLRSSVARRGARSRSRFARSRLVIATLARLPLARLTRGRRAWAVVAVWTLLATSLAALARARAAAHGADHVLIDAFGAIVLPMTAYTLVGAAIGGRSLSAASGSLVAFGAVPARAAGATIAVATGACALAGAVVAPVLALVAHGTADPSPLGDALASAYAGALGGVAYASWFALGATFGRRGGGRSLLLALDWVLGSGDGPVALLAPRGHLRNLLGGVPPVALPGGASAAALLVVAAACGLLAMRRAGPR